LVDAGDSKSPAARRAGSIPAPGTINKIKTIQRPARMSARICSAFFQRGVPLRSSMSATTGSFAAPILALPLPAGGAYVRPYRRSPAQVSFELRRPAGLTGDVYEDLLEGLVKEPCVFERHQMTAELLGSLRLLQGDGAAVRISAATHWSILRTSKAHVMRTAPHPALRILGGWVTLHLALRSANAQVPLGTLM
jgi:hypothetical protein